MASYYFPQDVLTDILLRLPAKTLVAYSCVSKIWRDIIVDPVFIDRHASKSHLHHHHQQKFLFLKEYPKEIDCEETPAPEVEFIEWPYENIFKSLKTTRLRYTIMGFCKGLVLLSGSVLALVNPSLHRFILLPPLSRSDNYAGGIWFDSVSNDYKVLIVCFPRIRYEEKPLGVISLYSLNKNSWEDITAKSQFSHSIVPYYTDNKLLFMNGYLHLIAYKRNPYRRFPDIFLRFDVTNEVFDTMSFPEVEYCSDNLGCSIASVFGKFSLGIATGFTDYSIWLMNEYGVKESWIMHFRVDISEIGQFVPKLLGSHCNGELLFDGGFGESAFSYDPKSNEGRCLGVSISVDSLYVDKLDESLVLFHHYQYGRRTPSNRLTRAYPEKGKTVTNVSLPFQ